MGSGTCATLRGFWEEFQAAFCTAPRWLLWSLTNLQFIGLAHEQGQKVPAGVIYVYVLAPYAGVIVGLVARQCFSCRFGQRQLWSRVLVAALALLILNSRGVILRRYSMVWMEQPWAYWFSGGVAAVLGCLIGIGEYSKEEAVQEDVGGRRIVAAIRRMAGNPAQDSAQPLRGKELGRFCLRQGALTVVAALTAAFLYCGLLRFGHAMGQTAELIGWAAMILAVAVASLSLVVLARGIHAVDIPSAPPGRDTDKDDRTQ